MTKTEAWANFIINLLWSTPSPHVNEDVEDDILKYLFSNNVASSREKVDGTCLITEATC
jgi:hypothetical protein